MGKAESDMVRILHSKNHTAYFTVSTEPVVIETEIYWIKCGHCRLIYMAFQRLHCECPICGFPLKNSLPDDCFQDLWIQRPGG